MTCGRMSVMGVLLSLPSLMSLLLAVLVVAVLAVTLALLAPLFISNDDIFYSIEMICIKDCALVNKDSIVLECELVILGNAELS